MVGGRGWGGGDPGVSLLSRTSLVEVGLCAGAAKCSWLQMAYPGAMPWIERSGEKASKAANGLPLRKRGTWPQNMCVCGGFAMQSLQFIFSAEFAKPYHVGAAYVKRQIPSIHLRLLSRERRTMSDTPPPNPVLGFLDGGEQSDV